MKRSWIVIAALFLCACTTEMPLPQAESGAAAAAEARLSIGEVHTFCLTDLASPRDTDAMFAIAKVTNVGEDAVRLGGRRFITRPVVRELYEVPVYENEGDGVPIRWDETGFEGPVGNLEASSGTGVTAMVLQPGEWAYCYVYACYVPPIEQSFPSLQDENMPPRLIERQYLSLEREFLCNGAPAYETEVRLPAEVLYVREDAQGVYAGVKVDVSAMKEGAAVLCGVIGLDRDGDPFYVMEGTFAQGEEGANMIARVNRVRMGDFDPVGANDIANTFVYAYVVSSANDR